MCGIAGLWNAAEPTELEAVARAMADAVEHRGPDGSGVWVERSAALAFSHRRLAIQDLSDAGAQPMRSRSGRYVITYNGEVYNFPALRRELEGLGHPFAGGSDTEVMLAAVEEWGLHRALERFVGMFAFALWDARERRLHLVRDRLGIKPLYYARLAGGLLFGSDLASFHRVSRFVPEIDRDVLALYFRYACVPGTRCIFRGCAKVAPGTVLSFSAADAEPREQTFWSAQEAARRGLAERVEMPSREATDRVEAALAQAIEDRRVADVPLGVFLSGGIDSSTVTALMQRDRSERVRTFSIGFREDAYDEARDARLVAAHLGTDHTELVLTPKDAMDAIPDLAGVYREPFADSSQLPTLLVCRLARREVTVVLSGDGGDEVFGGYNRHLWAPRVWRLLRTLPPAARHVAARGLATPSAAEWDAVADRVPLFRVRTPGDKVHKLAGLLGARDLDDLYRRLTSIWQEPSSLVLGASEPAVSVPSLEGGSVAEQLMLRDLVGYLADDILTKVDRASMSVALEVRVPLLDHRVVELAWSLPESAKIDGGVGKRVLRDVLARHVQPELIDRPKMGFGVPIDAWLRGPLREWAEALLDRSRLRREGWLDADAVARCWEDHLAERGTRQHQLWAVLMFQAWLEAEGRA